MLSSEKLLPRYCRSSPGSGRICAGGGESGGPLEADDRSEWLVVVLESDSRAVEVLLSCSWGGGGGGGGCGVLLSPAMVGMAGSVPPERRNTIEVSWFIMSEEAKATHIGRC